MRFLCKILVFLPITSIRLSFFVSLNLLMALHVCQIDGCRSGNEFRPKTASKLTTHGDDDTGIAVSNKRGSSYCNCLTKLRLYVSAHTRAQASQHTYRRCTASRHNGRFAMETLCLHTQKAIDGQNGYQIIIFGYSRIENVFIVMSCK